MSSSTSVDHRLTLCGAGAGTGKTYSICELIAEKVAKDDLDPARVIATTFTIKAAAELKGRIAARLLEADFDPSRAERLELAPIGTVHSVAYQLLSRYALHLGLSPRLRVADEFASERLLKLALQRTDPASWDELTAVAHRINQDDLEQTLLELIEEKRSNAIDDDTFRAQMHQNTARFLEILRGIVPVQAKSETRLFDRLQELASDALEVLMPLPCGTKATGSARTTLREIARGAHITWRDVVRATRIKAGKRSGADSHLNEIRDFAATVRYQPELHEDVEQFMHCLTEQTIALEQTYLSYKKERGLLDFTDLEVEFLRLLESDLAEDLEAEFDLVVVDEFQDTNPLQLTIFTRLRELIPESYWVGDEKQSIFGFRGTDARLMQDVWKHAEADDHRTLDKNYRSQRGLVEFVNRLFAPVFGAEAALEPHHGPLPETAPAGLQRWLVDVKTNEDEARMLARGIARLHREDRLPLRDIATLVRTNEQGRHLGEALTELGLPCVIELPGLLQYRECVLALAGLRLIADRRDSLAAATVVHLLAPPSDVTPEWLAERLEEVQRDEAAREAGETPREKRYPWQGNEALAPLDDLRARASFLTPTETLDATIAALRLAHRSASWSNPALRCGHLDAMRTHARHYEQQARDAGRPTTLTGVIAFFEQLSEEEQDWRFPQSGLDAVTIATYHASKGLEWPTVILTGLDHHRGPDLHRPATVGGDPASHDPLHGRHLHYWPWPFGRNQFGRVTSGSHLEEDTLTTDEGQAAVAEDDQESLRLLYVGLTRARDRLVVTHRPGKHSWLDKLETFSLVLDPRLLEGTHEVRNVSTQLLVEYPQTFQSVTAERAETQVWLVPGSVAAGSPGGGPAYLRPSAAKPGETLAAARLVPHELPGVGAFPSKLRLEVGAEARLGNAVHAYFAALPSLRSVGDERKAEVAAHCLGAYRCSGVVEPAALVRAGRRLEQWVTTQHPEATWFTETSVTAPHENGRGQLWGSIDLLLETDQGVVILDHKTGTPSQAGLRVYAKQYVGQLAAYSSVLEAAGQPSTQVLHLPLRDGWVIAIEPQ